MADTNRREVIKSLPLLAGGTLAAGFLHRNAQAAPNDASTRKVVAGRSPNYSRTVAFDRLLFVAGVLGTDPETGKLASPEFEGQCRQVLTNLKASVEAGGAKLGQVLQCTCFLVEAGDFEAMNKIYREFFTSEPPARSTVVVKELVMAGAKIEIDCIAHT